MKYFRIYDILIKISGSKIEEFFDFISIGEKCSLKLAIDELKKCNNLSRDEKLKRLVANIAAYYSSSSMSSTVAVNYTLVKNIKKIPGGKPGKVIINNYKTVYVDPDYNLFKDFILK